MDYWNRIDLHQHTDHDIDCNNKKVTSNYTHKKFYQWLEEENVKLKAVTCHNNIDIASHVKHSIIAEMLNINYLVGAEIDYRFNETEFHAITILNPNVNIIDFSDKLNKIRESNFSAKGDTYLNEDQFQQLHKNTSFLFIPHAIKTKGLFQEKNLQLLDKQAIDWVLLSLMSGLGEPVLFENTKKYFSYSLIEKIKYILNSSEYKIESVPSYIGSDYKFDNNQEKRNKILERVKYCIFAKPTYRGLEISIRNFMTRLSAEDDILVRDKYIESIDIMDGKYFKSSHLELSPGLNVIIGNSGTGKTLLLNQIFYQLKNKNLDAVMKSPKELKNNVYSSKTDNKEIIKINFNRDIANDELNIIEIPNLYSKILTMHSDDKSSIIKMFGLQDLSNSSVIVNQYKEKLNEFVNDLIKINETSYIGEQLINNINSAIDFLNNNKPSYQTFSLNIMEYDDNEYKKYLDKLNHIDDLIENSKKTLDYLNNAYKCLITENSKNNFKLLKSSYENFINSLDEDKKIYKHKVNLCRLDKILYEKINSAIVESLKFVGNKEKTYKSRESILKAETQKLITNIKNSITFSYNKDNLDLCFPYEKLKTSLSHNTNKFARITLDGDKERFTKSDILNDDYLYCVNNIKTKLKNTGLETINLIDSNEVKLAAKSMLDLNINLANILFPLGDVPTTVELYLENLDEWRLINKINKGDIAKKSMEYYFSELIRKNQPDIILIDQPENDVDKSFLAETLSTFIKREKLEKQIIITSHDAIVAINSDVNKIIEANVNDDNKMEYISYDLEYVDDGKLVATNKVSKILDGGKKNIMLRYQIYGGELEHEL